MDTQYCAWILLLNVCLVCCHGYPVLPDHIPRPGCDERKFYKEQAYEVTETQLRKLLEMHVNMQPVYEKMKCKFL